MSKLSDNIFLIATNLIELLLVEVGVLKVDYFDFSVKIFEKLVCIIG